MPSFSAPVAPAPNLAIAEEQPVASLPSPRSSDARRRDIQALRGIAVLYVVIYHGGFGVLKSGFLGVDVFFVISGYLITGMICRDIDAGRFRISEFYWRRAKRLLPATYVVLLGVALLSYFLLLPLELADTVPQLLGALTFTANIVLWRQSDYFAVAAHVKPLLHMWSLSIEEQFYLLLPLLLVVLPARRRQMTILALLVASLGTCFATVAHHPDAAFYLLPSRAWELLIGSLGAVWVDRGQQGMTAAYIGFAAVCIIIVLPFAPIDPVHPRFDALAICIATLFALKLRPRMLQDNRMAAVVAKVGDISFSLYLVHWPLLVFVRQVYLPGLPGGIRILLVLLSIVLAAALFRWIEHPLHHASIRPTFPILAGLVAAALVILAIPSTRTANWTGDTADIATRRPNFGFASSCNYRASFSPGPACQNSDNPQIAVWGDSLAMHLVPGLAATDPGLGLIQATRRACAPLLGVATTANGDAQGCIEFNDSVRTYLARAPNIRYVIVSTAFFQYLGRYRLLLAGGESVAASPDLLERALGATVSAVRMTGKKVAIVAPPPTDDFNVGLCSERLAAGIWSWPADCRISTAAYRQQNAQIISLLNGVSRKYDVPIIWPSDYLCDAENCKVLHGRIPLYVDEDHLTQAGSVAVFKEFDLFDKIIGAAR